MPATFDPKAANRAAEPAPAVAAPVGPGRRQELVVVEYSGNVKNFQDALNAATQRDNAYEFFCLGTTPDGIPFAVFGKWYSW